MTASGRLLWIHQNFVGDEQVGNRRALHVAAAFRRRGWTVDVIAPRTSYLEASFARRRRSYAAFLWHAFRQARTLPRPDLLFVSTPPLPQTALVLALAAWWRRPVVVEVRDLWPAFLLELGVLRRTPLVWLLEWLEAFAYRYADRCIVVSPAFAAYVERMGTPRERLAVVPSGGDPRLGEPGWIPAPGWRAENGLENAMLFVYAGSFNDAYDLDAVLDAADALAPSHPEIVWLFAGDGRQRARLAARAARAAHVRHLGPLPRTELWRILRTADAGVVTLRPTPLLRTVIPGKLLEYMGAGLPVLAWAGGSTAAILAASGAGILFHRADPAADMESLRAFAALPDGERRAMGNAGRAWMRKHMRADVLAERAADAVDAAVAQTRPGARRRFFTCAARSFWDVARRRPRSALAGAAGPHAEAEIRQSFHAWLAGAGRDARPGYFPKLL